jgi:hypothetical protein
VSKWENAGGCILQSCGRPVRTCFGRSRRSSAAARTPITSSATPFGGSGCRSELSPSSGVAAVDDGDKKEWVARRAKKRSGVVTTANWGCTPRIKSAALPDASSTRARIVRRRNTASVKTIDEAIGANTVASGCQTRARRARESFEGGIRRASKLSTRRSVRTLWLRAA